MEYRELTVFFIDNYQLKHKKIKIIKKQYDKLFENPKELEIRIPPLNYEKQENLKIVTLCKYWIKALTVWYYNEFKHIYIIYDKWQSEIILSHLIEIALENGDIIMSSDNMIISDKIKEG